MRGQLARGAVAVVVVTSLALLMACTLAACVDGRASLGRFADANPPPPPPPNAGVGGAAPAGATAPPLVPDAGHPFEPTPASPAPFDAGIVQLPEPEPPARACGAGSYRGDFVCALLPDAMMRQPGGSPPPPMMASLPFGLEPSADGMFADVVDGDFMFVAWGLGFTGRFEGRLDCASGRFSAIIADGMTGPLFMGGPNTFVGALDGQLDPVTGTLDGTWWHGPMPDTGCTGPWSAVLQAP